MSSPSAAPATWAPPLRAGLLLVVLSILVVGQMYSALALTDTIAASLEIRPADVTSATTTFGVAYAAGFLFAGPLSDRYGSRAVIFWGLLACTVTTAVVASAPNLGALVALRAVQGISAAALAPAAFAYVAHHIAPRRRPLVLTSVTGAMLGAAILIQIALAPLGEGIGWRGAFLVSAAAIGIGALLARIVLQPGPTSRDVSLGRMFRAIPSLLARREVLALYIGTVCVMTAFVGFYTVLALVGPAYLEDPDTLLILRATALPALVIIAVSATVLSRIPGLRRAGGAMLLAAVALAAASAASSSALALGVAQFVFVAAIAAAAPAIVQSVAGLAPGNAGTATAVYACSMFIGGSIGPQLVRSALPLGYLPVVLILAAVLVAGAAAVAASALFVRRSVTA